MNVIEAAKAAGWTQNAIDMASEQEMEQLKRLAQIIRNQALEDAAVCCDDEAEAFQQWQQGASDGRYDWKEDAAEDCAAAIRAMKKDQQ